VSSPAADDGENLSVTGHPTPAELAALLAALEAAVSASAEPARVERRWGRAARGWIAAGRAAITEG
jgi:hypothetical protein